MIYFIQTSVDRIKIGTTENLTQRLGQLKNIGDRLILLATIPGNRSREQEIHTQFAHLRIGHTELFRPADDLMDFIEKAQPYGRIADKETSKVRIVAEIDPEIMRRLRHFQADNDKSIREIIEDALHRHFNAMETPNAETTQ